MTDTTPQLTLITATRLATAASVAPRSRAMSSRNGASATAEPVTRNVTTESVTSMPHGSGADGTAAAGTADGETSGARDPLTPSASRRRHTLDCTVRGRAPALSRDTLGVMTPSTARALAPDRLLAFMQDAWDSRIVPTLEEYVRIPAKSPGFDREWQAHGHLDRAVELAARWARERPVEGLQVEVVRLPGRTPILLMEIPGTADETVLLYGHLDKQPEMVGWSEGLGPWTPVRRGDRLYGRGAADDGYAAFAALTAVESLQAQGVPHARCVILVETCEESGSADLPAYMDALKARIGTPGLVICLDASCGNYDQLWTATSLRGLVGGELSVEVLAEGIHSGASGDRALELPDPAPAPLAPGGRADRGDPAARPPRRDPARARAGRRGTWRRPSAIWARACRSSPACGPRTRTPASRSWPTPGGRRSPSPGADGLPPIADAGNVLRPRTAVKVSLRIPPTLDARRAARRLQELFEADPPYGAQRALHAGDAQSGVGGSARSPAGSRSLSSAPPRRTSAGRRCPRGWEGRSRS